MKYSRLPESELRHLEKEFIDFLVVNGIVAEDWVKLKESDSEAASQIIDQFSDVIWEGVLRKTQYLEKKETQVVYFFKCDADKLHLIKVSNIDGKMMQQTASKDYIKNREDEIFDLIKSGCEITDGEGYNNVV
jgi:hypothetical protein